MTHVSRLAILGLAITLGATAMTGAAEAREPRFEFEALDSNNDGEITREEMAERSSARFSQTDANGDGMLSLSELEAAGHERAKKRATRMMEKLDANDDGQLTKDEMQAARRGGPDRMFKRADADGDGAITKAEFDAVMAKFAKRHKH